VKKRGNARAEIAWGEKTTTIWPVFWDSGASIFDFLLNYADKRYIILRNANLHNGGC
jgi:hypothetical protein